MYLSSLSTTVKSLRYIDDLLPMNWRLHIGQIFSYFYIMYALMHFAPNMCLVRGGVHRREEPGRVIHHNIFRMFFILFRWELLGCFVLSFFRNSSSDIENSYLWRNKVLKEVVYVINLFHIE